MKEKFRRIHLNLAVYRQNLIIVEHSGFVWRIRLIVIFWFFFLPLLKICCLMFIHVFGINRHIILWMILLVNYSKSLNQHMKKYCTMNVRPLVCGIWLINKNFHNKDSDVNENPWIMVFIFEHSLEFGFIP